MADKQPIDPNKIVANFEGEDLTYAQLQKATAAMGTTAEDWLARVPQQFGANGVFVGPGN